MTTISEILTENYCDLPEALREDVVAMLHQIWPDAVSKSKPTHPPELAARSFFCRVDAHLVAYAAVLQKEIVHRGEKFRLAGLSCVATRPKYRKLGVGTRLVRAATDWMAQQEQLDFGVFTCHPDMIPFYRNAGDWNVTPELILIGNAKTGALNSQTLSVAVLQRIFSSHAQEHKMSLTHGTINLDFPDGEFI